MNAKIALAKMVGCVWICQETFCADAQWVGLIIINITCRCKGQNLRTYNFILYFDCLKCDFAIQQNLSAIKYVIGHDFVDFLWKLNLKYVGHT